MIDIMGTLLWVSAAVWVLFLVQGLLNAWLVPDVRSVDAAVGPVRWPSVSYLVPARNEERGIREAVSSFCRQDYPDFEVIVIDDRSTDATPRILRELQDEFSQLTVVEGTEPPPGWLGKPNALCRGEPHAKGDWILLADADAVHAPTVLRRAVALGIREDAGMVALRPRLLSGGAVEAALMSGITLFFFAATPMFLVRASRSPWFFSGSGVFNLLRRDALEACGGLACLKQAIVDDLEIGLRVKRSGFRLAVACAANDIALRMYNGVGDAVRGFTKNTYPGICRKPYLLPLYYVTGFVLSILPYVGLAVGLSRGAVVVPAAIALALMHGVLALISWRYRQPWCIIFLNPVRELCWMWIMTRSLLVYLRKGVVWRDRQYGQAL